MTCMIRVRFERTYTITETAEVHKQSEPDYVVLEDGQCVPYEC